MPRRSRVVALLWLGVCLTACGTDPVTIETLDGALRGTTDGDTNAFLGVPYATPPLGALRFAPPEPVVPWSEPLDATSFGPSCAQLVLGGGNDVNAASSEDCLYLNVWAPAQPGRYPVMVWIPGGGYIIGTGAQGELDGQHLSRYRDVVVVTLNYRLAAFGFLGHAALREAEGHTGNYGLLDQREALAWVRRNIESFHGDPENVTIFGESAGGGSICMHLVSPASTGAFERAIIESGTCTSFDHPTLDFSEAQGRDLSDALGCSGDAGSVIECLRAAATEDVLRALPPNEHFIFGEGVGWWPVVDGVFLEDQPTALLASGRSARVPIVIGANADEGNAFFFEKDVVVDEPSARGVLGEFFVEADIDVVLARYPLGRDPQGTMKRVFSDMFICDARRVARLHTAAGGSAHHYHFTFGFYDGLLGGGAFHTAEVPFVFGNPLGLPLPPAGIPLKNAVQGYWSSFARSGDPNGGGRARWSAYDPARDNSIRLDLSVSRTSGVRREACDFWDTLRLPAP